MSTLKLSLFICLLLIFSPTVSNKGSSYSVCPKDYEYFEYTCYRLTKDRGTFRYNEKACKKDRAHLAYFVHPREYHRVKRYAIKMIPRHNLPSFMLNEVQVRSESYWLNDKEQIRVIGDGFEKITAFKPYGFPERNYFLLKGINAKGNIFNYPNPSTFKDKALCEILPTIK